MVEMKVKGLAVDASTKMPVVVLTDAEERRYLPIWVGLFEANAILMEFNGIKSPRPMTHDLMKSLIETFNGQVTKIVINAIHDNTFFARIFVEQKDRDVKAEVDARPSDAIALALRTKVPILVAENVVVEATIMDRAKYDEESKKFKQFLEHIKPEDFGSV